MLRYARWTGSRWEVQTVDAGDLFSPSLALDVAANPHIAYYDGSNDRLRYARWTGSAWAIEAADTSAGGAPSIAVDGAGAVHVNYVDRIFVANDAAAKYARRVQGIWTPDVVQRGPDGGAATSLALDRAGGPHVAVALAGGVSYARKAAGAWITEFLGVGQSPSLRLDSADNPRVAYYSSSGSGQLLYARRSGGSWTSEEVDRGDAGRAAALALDARDDAQVTYEYVGAISGNSTVGLRHARWDGARWTISMVDAGTRVSGSSIALSAGGAPRVAYTMNGAVKYAEGTLLPFKVYVPVALHRMGA